MNYVLNIRLSQDFFVNIYLFVSSLIRF